ncbi:MAG: peptide ABC transporter substrate-binding protein, partial [Firmicutes bacterium]|nr:peptide ABC transporter substrate-binding protein [Bacillota bacterium]
MKKYLALLLSVVMVIGLFAGCSGGSDQPAGGEGGEAAGTDPYTGIPYSSDTEFDYLYSAEMTSWNYLVTSVSSNQKILANFVDTLIEYDNLGNIVPDLATSWEESEDGLTWTFHLREDAMWYTADGEEYAPVTANDFVKACQLVADVNFDSDMPDMLTSYIVNGSELYSGAIDDFSQLGVVAVDDHTLEFHLKNPCAYFL